MSDSTLSEQKSIIDTNRSTIKGGKQNQLELNVHRILQNAFQDMAEDTVDIKALLPISVLLEEMKSDYSSTRTYCLQNLHTIALVLGPARAKGLLGGFISNLLKDQENGVEDVPEELQVMLTLLESIPKLINLIGGAEHSIILLKPLLETLADRQKEESKNMYIKVIKEIAKKMMKSNKELIQETIITKIEELKDKTQQEQIAALLLISNLYILFDEETKMNFEETFKFIIQSKDSQVRKKTVWSLKDMAMVAEKKEHLIFILKLANEIFHNGKDFKSNLFYFIPYFYKHKESNEVENFEKFIQNLMEMKNNNSYNAFIEIVIETLYNMKENKFDFIQIVNHLFNLSKIQELEVRQKFSAIIGKFIVFIKECRIPSKNYFLQANTYLQEQVNEKNFLIKQNLVEQYQIILQAVIDKKIMLLKEDSYTYVKQLSNHLLVGDTDLKFKFLQKQKSFAIILDFIVNQSIPKEEQGQMIENLVIIIQGVEGCKNWRMRCQCLWSIVMLIQNLNQYKLVNQFQNYNLFDQTIKNLMQDRIAQVREESQKALNMLFTFYKSHNMQNQALQTLKTFEELLKHKNYMVRVNFILGLRVATYFGQPVVEILKQLKNEIPNVKIALLEVLLNSKQKYKIQLPYNELLPCNDQDSDVRILANNLKELYIK